MTRGKIALLMFLSLAGLAIGSGCWQKARLQAWWNVRELARSGDNTRERHARALADLGESAVGPLLGGMANDDETVCRNLEMGLRTVIGAWAVDDSRTVQAMEALRASFGSCSLEGRMALLRFAAAFANQRDDFVLPARIARSLGELVETSEAVAELRPAALGLAGALVEHGSTGQWQSMCRNLAIKWLADPNAATRVAAIQIVLREPLRKDAELLARLAPCLHDAEANVRRVALVALGTNTEVVREEQLLPLLHDGDAEVQRLCEAVLRSRGLNEMHIRMARLISHEDAAVRMQVIPLLRQARDLDADVWVRRLTLDPAPAVRAAAARLASVDPSDDLRLRLAEMARVDPSPTVREIARFYVERSNVRQAGN